MNVPRFVDLLPALAVSIWAFACTSSDDSGDTDQMCYVPGGSNCPCTQDAECSEGLLCADGLCQFSSETGSGDGDGDATETDAGDGDGEPSTGDGDATEGGDESCHPLMVDCPMVGTTCTWDGQSFLCNTATTKLGDSCVPDNPVCISGFCASQAMVPGCPSTHCCAAFCNLETGYCPVEGTSCVEYFPPGATTDEVGACLAQ